MARARGGRQGRDRVLGGEDNLKMWAALALVRRRARGRAAPVVAVQVARCGGEQSTGLARIEGKGGV
jgi:hypothetical protein